MHAITREHADVDAAMRQLPTQLRVAMNVVLELVLRELAEVLEREGL